MKNKKYLYLTVCSLLFWAMAGLYYVQSNAKLSANSMASLIQNQLSKTEVEANSLLTNSAFMSRLWSNSLSEQDLFFLASHKYIIQLYINGKLEYWNSNSYPVSEMHFIPKWKTIIENKNTFLYKSKLPESSAKACAASRPAIVLFPSNDPFQDPF